MSAAQTTAPVAVGETYANVPAPAGAPAAPAPEPAPAPAPVAPPAPAPAPEPTKPGALEPTGDPGLDLALDFISNAGIKADDPALEAAREGDFSLIEAKLAAMGDKTKGYDKFVALARQAYERHTKATDEANAAVTKMVHDTCGGEAGWAAVQAFASANATPEEKAQINAAFAAGGVQARAAAQYLQNVYEKAGRPGYREPKAAVKQDAGAGADGAVPMTAKAYAKAVQQLMATSKGRDISTSPEYKALQAQRNAARRAGH